MNSDRLRDQLRQATGPPRSGAGVRVGMLRGAGDSRTWKIIRSAKCPFHAFDMGAAETIPPTHCDIFPKVGSNMGEMY